MKKNLTYFFAFFTLLITNVSHANLEYRELISNKKFNELEGLLKQVNHDFLNDQINISDYYGDAFLRFNKADHADQQLLEQLKKWESSSPESVYAKTVLGDYYRSYAFFLRGELSSKNTSSEQFDLFKENNKKALKKYIEAIKISNSYIPAYGGLIKLDKYLSNLSFRNYEILNQSDNHKEYEMWENWYPPMEIPRFQQEQFPLFSADIFINIDERLKKSPYLWVTYIDTKEAKWGGSIQQMEFILKDAKNYVDDETHHWLKGVLIAEKAAEFEKSKNWNKVYDLTKSYFYDVTNQGYSDRAIGVKALVMLIKSSQKLSKIEECKTYSEKVISIREFVGYSVWGPYGKCLYSNQEWEKSAEAFKLYIKLESDYPYHRWALRSLSRAYEKMNKYPEAYAITKFVQNKNNQPNKEEILKAELHRLQNLTNMSLVYEGPIDDLLKPTPNFFK